MNSDLRALPRRLASDAGINAQLTGAPTMHLKNAMTRLSYADLLIAVTFVRSAADDLNTVANILGVLEPDVEGIRSAYQAGGISMKSVARQFGVDPKTVRQIVKPKAEGLSASPNRKPSELKRWWKAGDQIQRQLEEIDRIAATIRLLLRDPSWSGEFARTTAVNDIEHTQSTEDERTLDRIEGQLLQGYQQDDDSHLAAGREEGEP